MHQDSRRAHVVTKSDADSHRTVAAPAREMPAPAALDVQAIARAAEFAHAAIPPRQRAVTVLSLQRAIGNARTSTLLAPRAGSGSHEAGIDVQRAPALQRGILGGIAKGFRKVFGTKVDAKRADKLVREHFEKDLPEATKKNARAEGHVNIVDEAEFSAAYERVYGEIDDDYQYTNAFVDRGTDPPTVWGHKKRINYSTVLHEGMHFYSNLNWKNTTGFNANEGVTEFFTRQVVEKENFPDRDNYEDQFNEVKALVDVVSESTMRNAYFGGDVDGVKNALNAAAGDGAFDRWVQAMQDKKWGDARKALTKAPAPAPSG